MILKIDVIFMVFYFRKRSKTFPSISTKWREKQLVSGKLIQYQHTSRPYLRKNLFIFLNLDSYGKRWASNVRVKSGL